MRWSYVDEKICECSYHYHPLVLHSFPSDRQHLSFDDCLDDKVEDYYNRSVLYWKIKRKVVLSIVQKECRLGAYLPYVGHRAFRWINHYCLWRMASATPYLHLPSLPKLVLISSTHRGMARLSWPWWLVTYRDSLPTQRRSPIQALTGRSVE